MKYDLTKETEIKRLKRKLEFLLEKGAKVDLKEVRKTRTVSQNAYLHVVITLYGIEYGYTIEEAKTYLKRTCDFMTYEKNHQRFLKTTRGMDTKQLTEFIEWIRNFAGQQGLYIPSSEEYIENRFLIDQEIESYKQFI
jgi:hypothetical protein